MRVRAHTGINGGTSSIELENFTSKGDLRNLNFPVRFEANRNVGDGAGIGRSVNTTECNLATVVLGRSQPEREHGGVKETSVHHLEEGGSDAVDSEGVVGETENSVEPKKEQSADG